MAKYHKYVFDLENRKFVGDFEKMYQDESTEVFDSWNQEDSRDLQRKVCLALLESYNFNTILDLGCGKGGLTHVLKKNNNRVIGVDIAPTAIQHAQERYPDIDFEVLDISDLEVFDDRLKKWEPIDLVFSSQLLSYLKGWKSVLETLANHTAYAMVSLYIPEDPIGFVKNEQVLLDIMQQNFDIIEHVTLHQEKMVIVFASSKTRLPK